MLQSELMVSAQVKAEGDPLKSFKDRQAALLEERATFVEAISTIDEELTKLRRDMRREEKRLKLYRNVKDRIFEFVKEHEGVYNTTTLANILQEKGFGNILSAVTLMTSVGYLKVTEASDKVFTGSKPNRHRGVTIEILNSVINGNWFCQKDMAIDVAKQQMGTNLSRCVKMDYMEEDRTQRYKRYRITQKGLEWLRGQGL